MELYHILQDEQFVYLFMEYVPNINLFGVIMDGAQLSEYDAFVYFF